MPRRITVRGFHPVTEARDGGRAMNMTTVIAIMWLFAVVGAATLAGLLVLFGLLFWEICRVFRPRSHGQWKRWTRFGLRSLLLFVTASCVVMALATNRTFAGPLNLGIAFTAMLVFFCLVAVDTGGAARGTRVGGPATALSIFRRRRARRSRGSLRKIALPDASPSTHADGAETRARLRRKTKWWARKRQCGIARITPGKDHRTAPTEFPLKRLRAGR